MATQNHTPNIRQAAPATTKVPATTEDIERHTARARAIADLLSYYFANVRERLPELQAETIDFSLDAIIKEMNAIDRMLAEKPVAEFEHPQAA